MRLASEFLVLASDNAGKLNEMRRLFKRFDLQLHSQAEYAVSTPPEVGASFVENAILKARYCAAQTGLPSIADDSGLIVDALNGEPGLRSARYAGENATDADNVQKLLLALDGVSPESRQARFVCVIVLMRSAHDPLPIICEGVWHGSITREPVGQHGFGYDPVFYVPSQGCSSAELSASEKNQLSHRGQALRVLMDRLATSQ